MARKRIKLSEQIRRAIKQSGKSRYRIWKDTGIHQAALSMFMNGQRGLSIEAIDKLGDYLQLDLVVRRTTKRKVSDGR